MDTSPYRLSQQEAALKAPADPYAYWREALEGRFAAIVETEPQEGFYKTRSSGDFWLPVAIWSEQGVVWAMVGSEDASAAEDHVRSVWMRCAKYPVVEKDYRYAAKTGTWPGLAPASKENADLFGHNNPPEGFEAVAQAIVNQTNEARAWLKERTISSQEDADRCETWANHFLSLRKRAEADHKVEKTPHLDAGRKVDAKYKPLIDVATKMVSTLKNAATQYLIEREAEKRAAAAQSIAKGEVAPARQEVRATTSGNSGRKLALRTHKFAVVDDWDKAIAFFKDNPQLREVVQGLADDCAKIGAPVPGVTFKEEQRAA